MMADDTYNEALDAIVHDIDERNANDNRPAPILREANVQIPRFKTSIPEFDDKLSPSADPSRVGFPAGRMLCINGAPFVGKSLLLCQVGLSMARQGLKVVMLCLDEPRVDAAERIGQGLGFLHKELNADYPGVLDAMAAKMKNEKIDIRLIPDEEVESQITIEDAGEFLLKEKAEVGYVLSVDSLHTAICRDEEDNDSPRVKIQKRMAALRALRHVGVMVLFSCEAARGAYASRDPNMRTAALAAGAESRAIEFGSDVVVMLSEGTAGSVKAEIAKNRVGRKLGVMNLQLDNASATLRTVDPETLEANEEAMREAGLLGTAGKVVDAIEEHGAMNAAGVMEHVKGRENKITDALALAVKNGRLVKVKNHGKGGGWKYELPSRV